MRLPRLWSFFMTLVCLDIIVAMMLPGLFGLQSFTQWGGMYVNAWCGVHVYNGDPRTTPKEQLKTMYLTAGSSDTLVVWYGPQYSMDACAEWARSRCGHPTRDGWTIAWAVPYFREEYFLGEGKSACALAAPTPYPWYYL